MGKKRAFSNDDVVRAISVIRTKYEDIWRELIASELNFDQENRDCWDNIRHILKDEGFVFNNFDMNIFVSQIRSLIDFQYVPFLLDMESIDGLRSIASLTLPFSDDQVDSIIYMIYNNNPELWSKLLFSETKRISLSDRKCWFELIKFVNGEGISFGFDYDGLLAQSIREKIVNRINASEGI